MAHFVLVHSPLVGGVAWTRVAHALRSRGHSADTPNLHALSEQAIYYWLAHAKAVGDVVNEAPADEPIVLVGWSGAGVLLPPIAAHTQRDIAAYIFVDADIPVDGKSRLDLFTTDQEREQFRALAPNGLLPVWPDAMLEALIPDRDVRMAFIDELAPCPLDLYEEPIPVFADWPDAPCGYVHFSASYDASAQEAVDRGWPLQHLEGNHFHLMNSADEVADTLSDLARALRRD